MAGPLYYDRVMESSTTTGTGTYTLAGAITGYQSFAVVADGNSCHYCAMEVDGNGNPSGGWEVGLGTFTLAGTTLSRTTILASTNGGAAVSWAAGTRRIFLVAPALNFGPASMSVLTSGVGATYTVPAGVYRLRVRVQGAGGGGGGADGGSAQAGCGGGGGGGSYVEQVYQVVPGQTFTYTIGTGGAGGVAGNNAGTAGGGTTFDNGGSILTAAGGTGGASVGVAGTAFGFAGGGIGGVPTGGAWGHRGDRASLGIRISGTTAWGGQGGNSTMGAGGAHAGEATGGAGLAYGGGGAGSSSSTTTDRAGGAGADGVILVEEFHL